MVVVGRAGGSRSRPSGGSPRWVRTENKTDDEISRWVSESVGQSFIND